MRRPWLALGLSTLVLLLPTLALAWTREASFSATVHGHAFKKVVVESSGCTIRYRLSFVAPEQAYASPERGYYRFKGRIQFHAGRALVSPTFANRGAGARIFSGVYDTTSEGCWAKQEQKLLGVDVEGCRGGRCTPEPFQN